MPRLSKALVTTGDAGFALADVELGEPQRDEVLVQIMASGVCHTDLDMLNRRFSPTSWATRVLARCFSADPVSIMSVRETLSFSTGPSRAANVFSAAGGRKTFAPSVRMCRMNDEASMGSRSMPRSVWEQWRLIPSFPNRRSSKSTSRFPSLPQHCLVAV